MKRFLSFAATILCALTLITSCNKDDDRPTEYSMLATVVDGSWATGNFTILFDDGKEAFVENSSAHTIKGSAYIDGQTRAVVTFYYVDGVSKEGFDCVINVVSLYQVPTYTLSDLAHSGITNIENYDAGLTIDMAFVANDFVNLAIKYPCSQESATKHAIKLVYNPDHENSVYKELYKAANSDYLYLELYHDDMDDKRTHEYSIYNCYKLIPSSIGINLDDYKGIKVLYKSLDGKDSTFPIKL